MRLRVIFADQCTVVLRQNGRFTATMTDAVKPERVHMVTSPSWWTGRRRDRKKGHVQIACLVCHLRLDPTRNEVRTYDCHPDGDHDPPLTMANVVQPHPQIDFHSNPLGHPPQIGLGLTLSMPTSLVGRSPHTHASCVQPSPSAVNPSRTLKRRFEQDEEHADQSSGHSPGARDVAMERSPTPERSRRSAPKRARNNLTFAQEHKGGRTPKDVVNSNVENQDVDVGVLLG